MASVMSAMGRLRAKNLARKLDIPSKEKLASRTEPWHMLYMLFNEYWSLCPAGRRSAFCQLIHPRKPTRKELQARLEEEWPSATASPSFS